MKRRGMHWKAPLDPKDEGTLLPPVDPRDEDTLLPPVDPKDEGTLLPPVDPKDEGTLLPPVDPRDEGTLLPPVDPDEWRYYAAAKRRRRHGGRRRAGRRATGTSVLCGDDFTGRPGNVRTRLKKDYSGAVIIRMAPRFATSDHDDKNTLRELAQEAGIDALVKILDDYDLPSAPRVATRRGPQYDDGPEIDTSTMDYPATVRRLEQEATQRGIPPLHSVLSYWRVDVNAKTRKEKVILLRQLNELTEVDYAYRELAATDPNDDTFEGSQGYLDKAPVGIDAAWAGAQNGNGESIRIVDLEQGWITNHPDLAPTDLLHGINRHEGDDDYTGDHGTAVLGEIVSKRGTGNAAPPESGTGVVGIAPKAKVGLASHYRQDTDAFTGQTTRSNGHVAEAILAAISSPNVINSSDKDPYLREGDVLLIEVQRDFLPTEVDPADFDAIRLATALGIIVVEAAGNGGRDLDAYQDELGAYIFKRDGGGFRESGAIMVGAALSSLPHDRKRASNHGSRVDCYAWGTRVVTTGYGDLGSGVEHGYTADFSNTSAAAPIIAGAALVLQSMYRTATITEHSGDGQRLLPGQMRALLADPATGTPQGPGRHGHIGVMPDLRAIAENSLRIVPDVYLRDHVGDTGAAPASRRICACPDVLVSPKSLTNLPKHFQNPALVSKAVTGQANSVYVRMMNRGLCDAEDVEATVYWSEAATLVTPDRWNEIGRCAPKNVLQGDTPAYSDRIPWTNVPEPGTYCLVVLIEGVDLPTRVPPGLLEAVGAQARNPNPEPPALDWFGFLRFQRDHNHFAIRNIHGVEDLPAVGQEKELSFLITGTPAGDRGRFFDLEVLQGLPKGAELSLDVPLELAPALRGPWRSEPIDQGGERYLRFHLPPLPRVPFCGVPLAAGAAHGCSFNIRVVAAMKQGGHSIAIRQLYRGLEVGRVSFEIRGT